MTSDKPTEDNFREFRKMKSYTLSDLTWKGSDLHKIAQKYETEFGSKNPLVKEAIKSLKRFNQIFCDIQHQNRTYENEEFDIK